MYVVLNNKKTWKISVHAQGCQHANAGHMETYGYTGDDAAALAAEVDADLDNAPGFTTLAPCAKKGA